ncbi:MAG: hypothetical protein NTW59_04020, partial [Candidatus Diapherotrites archaeon]|nr:hypothetical protein [Candidatus Diapherotrites archaeon]
MVMVTAPNGGQYIKGTYLVTFDVNDLDSNYLTTSIYYNTAADKAGATAIVSDVNISDSTAAIACTGGTGDLLQWITSKTCTYSWNTTLINGNFYIVTEVKDKAGPPGTVDSSDLPFNLDNNKPYTWVDYNKDTWQGFDANLVFRCSDIFGFSSSGCSSITASGASCSGLMNDSNMLYCTVSSDGNTTVSFYSTDRAGNAGDTNTIYTLVDKAAPTVNNKSSTDSNKAKPVVYFDLNDSASGVRVSDMNLFIDGNKIAPATTQFGNNYHVSWTFTYDLATGKTVYIGVQVADNAGHSTGDVNWNFSIDTNAPAIAGVTISDTNGYTNDETPTISLSGITGGTPSYMSLGCSDSNWKAWQAYATSASDLNVGNVNYSCKGSTDGSVTVHLRLKDAAGNISASVSDSTYLDRNAPSPPPSLTASSDSDGNINLGWTASIEGSGSTITYY